MNTTSWPQVASSWVISLVIEKRRFIRGPNLIFFFAKRNIECNHFAINLDFKNLNAWLIEGFENTYTCTFIFFFAIVFQNTCSLMLTKLVHAGLDEMHNIQKRVTESIYACISAIVSYRSQLVSGKKSIYFIILLC